MNKQELDIALEFVNNPEGELQIIFYANINNIEEPQKLDIKGDDLPILKNIFLDAIQNFVISKDDYAVLQLSTADERGRCFYQYDLEVPQELQMLQEVIGNDNLQTFNFNSHQLSDINSLIVVIADDSNEVTLYKKLSSVEVIGRGGYLFMKHNQRLERFEDQLLRITPKFQLMRVAGEIIIIDLNAIERSFGFYDIITREAAISLSVISEMQLINNITALEELVNNISFARKLTKVARNSPVIKNNIPNANIIEFAKTHPFTRNRMRYNEEGTQFLLDTRVSKDLLIKILNDDLLTSELTKLYYDSLAKDDISVEDNTQIENGGE
ncbi:anti-phage protein KwaB [Edaphocola aurantiacus]|uniref:anti-phage protein KwaB n=1 Tax=Edaphocola aurantiacus TaxID=2601682 RepID=UPI001C97BD9F|nr:anti-phage protein KwaB [Edaphocola aurantiacus]